MTASRFGFFVLHSRPWTTEVHKLPVLQLLSDDAAADAIAAELRSYGCAQRQSGHGARRTTAFPRQDKA